MKQNSTVSQNRDQKQNSDSSFINEANFPSYKLILEDDGIKVSNNESFKIKKNKYQKLKELHVQLTRRKEEQEAVLRNCEEKEYSYRKLRTKIEQKRKQKELKIKIMEEIEEKKKISIEIEEHLFNVKMSKKNFIDEHQQKIKELTTQIKALQDQCFLLQEKKKQRITEKDSHLICFLKGKLSQKQQELLSLEIEEKNYLDDTNATEFLSLKQSLAEKKEECLALKTEKEKLKNSIKTLKKKQFEINECQSKQERENQDVKQEIEKVNEKIKKQVNIDEKLRLQLMKKIQDIEAKKTHPKDFPYEDLRKLKEQNHQLKVELLHLKQNYEKQKEVSKDLVPFEVIEEMKKKTKKAQNYYEKIKNSPNQNLELQKKIHELESSKVQVQKERTNEMKDLEGKIQEKQNYLIDLKATVKVLKKQAQNVKGKLSEYKNLYPNFVNEKKQKIQRKKKEEQKEEKARETTEKEIMIQTKSSFQEKEEKNIIEKKNTGKVTVNKVTKKLKNEQIPILEKNNMEYDMVYVVKPKKWHEFWLVTLILAGAIFYYSFKRHFGIW